MDYFCWSCGQKQESRKVFRADSCENCNNDLRCCKNCTFYDEKHYNDCRETQAERITLKEKGNFCDFFVYKNGFTSNAKSDTLTKLDDLFKK